MVQFVVPRTKPGEGLKSWSHSRAEAFSSCKYRVYLMHVQRVPEPPRPLPPGMSEHANDRGTRIHQASEDYVSGKRDDLIKELNNFAPELGKARRLYALGMVSLEGEWGVDENWQPTAWKQAWHRSKLDMLVMPNPKYALVIDLKSGRRFGNEIKHATQMNLYAVNTAFRYPAVERIRTELWYSDVNELHGMDYTREQALRFEKKFTQIGNAMVTNTEWKPNPNVFTCKYCMYGPWGTGHCPVGVKKDM